MSKLMKFVADNDLTRNVRFLGHVPEGALNEWYNRVSGFVMPSLFEGFGIPVIEAMAAGTPVIGTDVDGIRCLIEDGKTGVLVTYGDEAAMAQAILRVCRGDFVPPDDLIERTRAAHDWDTVAKRYHRILLGQVDITESASGLRAAGRSPVSS